MSKYNAAVFTNAGRNLLLKCLAKEAELQFTRIAFGEGTYEAEEYLSNVTSLKSEFASVPISVLTAKSGNSVQITGILSNKEMECGHTLYEVGLYARDSLISTSEEVLYAICTADIGFADYLPAYNGYAESKVQQDFYVDVADSSKTTILVDDSVCVSKKFLEENFYNMQSIDDKFSSYNKEINTKISTVQTEVNNINGVSAIEDHTENTLAELIANAINLGDIHGKNIFRFVYLNDGVALLYVNETAHQTGESYTVTQKISLGSNTYSRSGEMGVGIMRPSWSDWEKVNNI